MPSRLSSRQSRDIWATLQAKAGSFSPPKAVKKPPPSAEDQLRDAFDNEDMADFRQALRAGAVMNADLFAHGRDPEFLAAALDAGLSIANPGKVWKELDLAYCQNSKRLLGTLLEKGIGLDGPDKEKTIGLVWKTVFDSCDLSLIRTTLDHLPASTATTESLWELVDHDVGKMEEVLQLCTDKGVGLYPAKMTRRIRETMDAAVLWTCRNRPAATFHALLSELDHQAPTAMENPLTRFRSPAEANTLWEAALLSIWSNQGADLVRVLMDNGIFPESRVLLDMEEDKAISISWGTLALYLQQEGLVLLFLKDPHQQNLVREDFEAHPSFFLDNAEVREALSPSIAVALGKAGINVEKTGRTGNSVLHLAFEPKDVGFGQTDHVLNVAALKMAESHAEFMLTRKNRKGKTPVDIAGSVATRNGGEIDLRAHLERVHLMGMAKQTPLDIPAVPVRKARL